MNAQHVLDLNQRLHQWMEKYNPELEKDIAQWLRKHAIDSTENLDKAFSQLVEENRLLQIGVVGRVKAGKSSLLNALIFDGHAILPRAATPMTADNFMSDFWVMIAASILFVLFSAGRKQRLNRLKGIILLGGFIAWLTSLFMGY